MEIYQMANSGYNKSNRKRGCVYQRKSDGRWCASITIGYDDFGRQKKRTVYGHSRTEAMMKLAEITGRITNSSYNLLETKTFGELMEEWLLVFKKSSVTPRSFEGEIRNFRNHIEPFIGNMKVYEVDTFVVQKLINKMLDDNYNNNTVKKIKHLLGQFFEYAIDCEWVKKNPVLKIKVKIHDRKVYSDGKERYKALTPEIRSLFLEKLDNDNEKDTFLKPLCYTMMFAGLRIAEAIALKWKNVDFEQKKLKIERAITQVPKFDDKGNIIKRVTVVGDTKTTCSVREIPIADVIVDELLSWKDKQLKRQIDNKIRVDLTSPDSFIFANDDGSVRTYSGCRSAFDYFKERNGINNLNIHFHGLRHTFSNMLFEMNENPKAIQQLLGHRDVKTTIMVYNSVNNDYIRQTTDKFNEKLKQDQIYKETVENESTNQKHISNMSNDELDNLLEELLYEKIQRRKNNGSINA